MSYDPNQPNDQFGKNQGFGGQPDYGNQPNFGGGQGSTDDKTFAMLAHLLGLIGFIGPLIIMLTKGNDSQYVRNESVESLNFQITLFIAWIVATLLIWLFFPPFVVFVAQVVFPILGAMAANKGQPYRYPVAIRLVK